MIRTLFKKIVVAYNGSISSLHAVMYGVMMAKIYKCQVKVVYVVDTDSIKRLVLKKFLVNDETILPPKAGRIWYSRFL